MTYPTVGMRFSTSVFDPCVSRLRVRGRTWRCAATSQASCHANARTATEYLDRGARRLQPARQPGVGGKRTLRVGRDPDHGNHRGRVRDEAVVRQTRFSQMLQENTTPSTTKNSRRSSVAVDVENQDVTWEENSDTNSRRMRDGVLLMLRLQQPMGHASMRFLCSLMSSLSSSTSRSSAMLSNLERN